MLKVKDVDMFVLSGACLAGGGYVMNALTKSNLKPIVKVVTIIPWAFWTVKQMSEMCDSIDGTLNKEEPSEKPEES